MVKNAAVSGSPTPAQPASIRMLTHHSNQY